MLYHVVWLHQHEFDPQYSLNRGYPLLSWPLFFSLSMWGNPEIFGPKRFQLQIRRRPGPRRAASAPSAGPKSAKRPDRRGIFHDSGWLRNPPVENYWNSYHIWNAGKFHGILAGCFPSSNWCRILQPSTASFISGCKSGFDHLIFGKCCVINTGIVFWCFVWWLWSLNMYFVFDLWKDDPKWLMVFGGVETRNQLWLAGIISQSDCLTTFDPDNPSWSWRHIVFHRVHIR